MARSVTALERAEAEEIPREPGPGGAAPPRRATGWGAKATALVTALLLVALIVVPVAFVLFGATRSGTPGDPNTEFTLEPLRTAFTTRPYLGSLVATVLLGLVVSGLAVVVGALLAWLVARTDLPKKGFFELVALGPMFLSPFVGAIAWVTLAAPNSGMINVSAATFFGATGSVVNVMTLGGLVFVMALYFVPYGYLFASAAFKNMDPALEEASYLCGAGIVRTALWVTLPLIRPALLSAFFLVTVLVMGVFSIPAVLAADIGFSPLPVRVYRAITMVPSDYGLAAAIGASLLLIAFVGVWLYRRAVRASKRFVTVTARGFRPRLVPLGRMKAPAIVLCVMYGLLSIVLPYTALIIVSFTPYTITDLTALTFTTDHFVGILTSARTYDAIVNTLVIGLIAPALCVLLAMVVSFIVERTDLRGRRLLEYVTTAPVAIPGIVFATGFVWAYVYTPLYATIWILVAAFVASYLPHANRITSASLLQIDRTLEEAATVSGATQRVTMSRITLPLSRPALLSGWILVFVLVSREINAAIILVSPRTMVLSVLAYDYVQFGDLRAAAVIGLIQTAVLVLGVLVARYALRTRLTGL